MKSALELTKRQLNSDAFNRSQVELIPIEDCRFKNFTDFLDEIDVFKNPVVSRGSGKFKQGIWSLLGYGTNTYRQESETETEGIYGNEEDNGLVENVGINKYDIKWEYTLFNGFFTSESTIERATKQDLEKLIKETERFIEKTFLNDLINDVNEIRDLQEQLLEQNGNDDLDRIDICIITDKEIVDQDKLPTRTIIQSINLECRIYYWDIRRWDAMRRSKSKREPIDIDFSSGEYEFYDVPYLSKQTGTSIDYFLAIFPGDLIADLYDLHNTRLLENNVRVFLSATKKANKGIRDTVKEEAIRFFSYNNGISATAEAVEVYDGSIKKIKNFQIVNGGQTTATLHYCRKKHRPSLSLKNVYVAVKITALQKGDEYSIIVGKISEAANTQSAISPSDFWTNDKKLILLEQLSMKTPTQNNYDRNVYYFFERMKGQYNVLKSSQGTKTQQRIWENNYPDKLAFDKLDLARWSNMMNELPHLVAEGAQKQFESYMKEVYFRRSELHLESFKYLVGFGMVFRRIYKLCGTAQGKSHLYPSRIIDLTTKQHVPVAASTAIYAASYLHMVTEGRLDYWSIFDFEFNLCNSILFPTQGKGNKLVRSNSELDNVLEIIIDEIWKNIATYGGAAAQEKSKKEECWNYVKKEAQISKDNLDKLKGFLITKKELDERLSNQSIDVDYKYFSYLHVLLENNASVLSNLYSIALGNSEYASIKNTISNLIKKIKNKNNVLTQKRIEEVYGFYENLIDQGFQLNEASNIVLDFNIDINSIYTKIFMDKNFLEKFKTYIYSEKENQQINSILYSKTQEIIENYSNSYGLCVEELLTFSNVIYKLHL